MQKMKKKISVVIPTWNGQKLLEKNLPKVMAALPRGTEVVVVDDGSTDKSIDYLKTLKSKTLKLIFNKKNKGFIYSVNKGFRQAGGDFVVLLNNDVVPQNNFLTNALSHFADPKVFAVSFNEPQFGWAKIWWRGGFIHHGVGEPAKKPHVSAWASGGSAIFRKSIWNKLKGFDPLYAPFYWEDFDLGYRAWKQGYKIIWEPNSVVKHKHESTVSQIDSSYVDLVKERNQLLFIWKNIDSKFLKFSNVFGIILRIILGPNYLKVFWAARKRYLKFNKPKIAACQLTDHQVLNLFK